MAVRELEEAAPEDESDELEEPDEENPLLVLLPENCCCWTWGVWIWADWT